MENEDTLLNVMDLAVHSPNWEKDGRGNWFVTGARKRAGVVLTIKTLDRETFDRLPHPFGPEAASAWAIVKRALGQVNPSNFVPLPPLPPKYKARRGAEVRVPYGTGEERLLGEGLPQIIRWGIQVTKGPHADWLKLMWAWGAEDGIARLTLSDDVMFLTGHIDWP